MPTGYTAELDDHPRLTTAKWVTKHLSRAFGVCVTLRDGPFGLSPEEIEAYLEKEIGRSTSDHKENLSEAEETLKSIESDPEVWIGLHKAEVERLKKSNARSVKKASKTNRRHERVKKDLIKLRDNTDDEVTRNIAKYGLKQLEIVKSDTEPYIQEVPDLEKFKTDKLASLNWTIEYHTKKMEKTEKRERERVLAYQKIRSEVEKILGPEASKQ